MKNGIRIYWTAREPIRGIFPIPRPLWAAEEDPAQVPVRDIMTRNCATVSPGDDCREATRLMAAQQVRRLPVTEGGKIVGIVSLGDLAKCQAFDMEAAKALSEISENIIRP